MPAGITLNSRRFFYEDLLGNSEFPPKSPFENDVVEFLRQWNSGQKEFEVMSSGSTGEPKKLSFSREQFIISANQTIATFKLRPGQNTLLCLSPQFIAGKMMLVRAFVGELNLVAIEPAENPLLSCNDKIHFAAIVPHQLSAMLKNKKTQRKVEAIDTVIVGGGAISTELSEQVKGLKNNVYQTYGMTETLTHIAIRKISGADSERHYTLLKGVKIDKDGRNCLRVKSPVNTEWLTTNDVVEIIDESRFVWLGRYDNIINSGGVKISPEEMESKLEIFFSSKNHTFRFFLAGIPDETLGEKLILVIEGSDEEIDAAKLMGEIKTLLPKYKSPKDVLLIPQFIYTPSGKIKRKETLNLAPK